MPCKNPIWASAVAARPEIHIKHKFNSKSKNNYYNNNNNNVPNAIPSPIPKY